VTTKTDPRRTATTRHSSSHPGKLDPDVAARWEQLFGEAVRARWPGTFEGLEHVPTHDRFIVIANHSGMGAAELGSLAVGWKERFGDTRPVAGMAHPAGFRVPGLRYFLRGFGAVEATREGAAWAREHGVPLLLFPGGDQEATRPIWHAKKVDFAGRKGWIRLAREHGLSIVPLCISGSHVTNPIVAHGKAIAWLTGARFFGAHRAPLPALSLVAAPLAYRLARGLGAPRWVSALGAWSVVPPTMFFPYVPARIGFHFLPEIPLERFADPADDDALYREVVGSLQRTLLERSGAGA